MSPSLIAQLVISLGPPAFQFIQDLMDVWSLPTLTLDQVMTITCKAQKSYDDYIAQAKSAIPK